MVHITNYKSLIVISHPLPSDSYTWPVPNFADLLPKLSKPLSLLNSLHPSSGWLQQHWACSHHHTITAQPTKSSLPATCLLPSLPQVADPSPTPLQAVASAFPSWGSGHFWISTGVQIQSVHMHKRTGPTMSSESCSVLASYFSQFFQVYILKFRTINSYKVSWEQNHKGSFQLQHCTHFHVKP